MVKSIGPVAIGGVGGSGTRVVAEIIKRLGFYIGGDLNSANDNLWFTVLFKRSDWFSRNHNNETEILRAFSIFEKIMTGEKLNSEDGAFIFEAAKESQKKGHDKDGNGKGIWPYRRSITIFLSKKFNPNKHIGWGWKEPNTHLYLPFLVKAFKDVKYIHVIRNGLDMAFSKNQAQLFNRAHLFGLSTDTHIHPLPKLSLNYRIKANYRAIEFGKTVGERFMVVNFDRLCLSPEKEIENLLKFLDVSIDEFKFKEIINIIKIPSSLGRFKNYDLSLFSAEEVKAGKYFGFNTE